MTETVFHTDHNLDFEGAIWDADFIAFRVGTCHGLYGSDDKSYFIVAIQNDVQGNGHLEDVFQWFENSCRRDGKRLRVIEIMNPRFGNYLINKRGFIPDGENCVVKHFK